MGETRDRELSNKKNQIKILSQLREILICVRGSPFSRFKKSPKWSKLELNQLQIIYRHREVPRRLQRSLWTPESMCRSSYEFNNIFFEKKMCLNYDLDHFTMISDHFRPLPDHFSTTSRPLLAYVLFWDSRAVKTHSEQGWDIPIIPEFWDNITGFWESFRTGSGPEKYRKK